MYSALSCHIPLTEELERGKRRSGVRLIVEVTDLKYSAETPPVVSEITEEIENSLYLWVHVSKVIMQPVKISQVCQQSCRFSVILALV